MLPRLLRGAEAVGCIDFKAMPWFGSSLRRCLTLLWNEKKNEHAIRCVKVSIKSYLKFLISILIKVKTIPHYIFFRSFLLRAKSEQNISETIFIWITK